VVQASAAAQAPTAAVLLQAQGKPRPLSKMPIRLICISPHSYGNKSSDHQDTKDGKSDSTVGKLMEKAGGMLHNDNMAEKGRAKREEAARDSTY